MVNELASGEWCVCELTEMIGADISTVSNGMPQLLLTAFGITVMLIGRRRLENKQKR